MNRPDLEGGWQNARKLGDESAKVWAAFVVGVWRLAKKRDSHSYVDLPVEMLRASPWLWGHLIAIGVPVYYAGVGAASIWEWCVS